MPVPYARRLGDAIHALSVGTEIDPLIPNVLCTIRGECKKCLCLATFGPTRDQPDVNVQRIDSQELAERMVFSLQEERMEFLSYYFKYRFAFPRCSNPLIDQTEEIQRRLILRAVANKEAYAIYHPYPFSIPSLFDTLRPYCD